MVRRKWRFVFSNWKIRMRSASESWWSGAEDSGQHQQLQDGLQELGGERGDLQELKGGRGGLQELEKGKGGLQEPETRRDGLQQLKGRRGSHGQGHDE